MRRVYTHDGFRLGTYILDSGAPCAFLKREVAPDELFFVMGWTLTDLCTRILKNVINHTRNIQSKDFERLPYPDWVAPQAKDHAIAYMKGLVCKAKAGKQFNADHPSVRALNEFYEYRPSHSRTVRASTTPSVQARLF